MLLKRAAGIDLDPWSAGRHIPPLIWGCGDVYPLNSVVHVDEEFFSGGFQICYCCDGRSRGVREY